MDDRFIEVPVAMVPDDTLARLLSEFVSRQGADSTDTEEGELGWVAQLKPQFQRGKLVIMHDLQTETTEIMTREQWRDFQRQLAEQNEGGNVY